jgi:RNAse (barnase) inhibitor barstar
MPGPAQSFELRGEMISDLESFYFEIERILGPGVDWFGRNLDALDEVMEGNVGRLPAEFTLIWRNADRSRVHLGHEAHATYLRSKLTRCHPSARDSVRMALREAEAGRGPTLFELLVSVMERRIILD